MLHSDPDSLHKSRLGYIISYIRERLSSNLACSAIVIDNCIRRAQRLCVALDTCNRNNWMAKGFSTNPAPVYLLTVVHRPRRYVASTCQVRQSDAEALIGLDTPYEVNPDRCAEDAQATVIMCWSPSGLSGAGRSRIECSSKEHGSRHQLYYHQRYQHLRRFTRDCRIMRRVPDRVRKSVPTCESGCAR